VAGAGNAALFAAEVNAGIEVFRLLEPEVQKAFVALFHHFHHKQQISAAQFLAEAATELQQANAGQPKMPAIPSAAADDLPSISLNPDVPTG
jgi:hypothetical protein